jgi:DNA polymerase III alpha subunit
VNSDKYGRAILDEQEAFDALYSGKIETLKGVNLDLSNTIEQFNNSINQNADRIPKIDVLEDLNDLDVKLFDNANQCDWFMPDDYCPNLVEMLYGMCTTKEQTNRVSQELELFIQHGMYDLLFYLKYLVDTMREHNIVWGVGRGSSVASYVLYLIGVHKIDSIKYELDINEFLK